MSRYPKITNKCIYIDAAFNYRDKKRLEYSPIFKYCRYTSEFNDGGYIYKYDNENPTPKTSIGKILKDYDNPIYDDNNKVETLTPDYEDAVNLVLNTRNPLCVEFLKHIYCNFNETKNRYELKKSVFKHFDDEDETNEDETNNINNIINTIGNNLPISELVVGNIYVVNYTVEHYRYDDEETINCGMYLGTTNKGLLKFAYFLNPIDIPLGYAPDDSDDSESASHEENPMSYWYFIFFDAVNERKPHKITKQYINKNTWHNVKAYVTLESSNISYIKQPTPEIVEAYINLFGNPQHNPNSLDTLNNFVHPFDMVMAGLNAVGVNPSVDNVYDLAEHLPKGGRTKRNVYKHRTQTKRRTRK
jgi:hypothetical protein